MSTRITTQARVPSIQVRIEDTTWISVSPAIRCRIGVWSWRSDGVGVAHTRTSTTALIRSTVSGTVAVLARIHT